MYYANGTGTAFRTGYLLQVLVSDRMNDEECSFCTFISDWPVFAL